MRQEICVHNFRGVAVGDRIEISAASTDTSFVVDGDLFRQRTVVDRWPHNEIMGHGASHEFASPGIFTGIIDIAYTGAAAITLTVKIVRQDGTTHSTKKVCEFTGQNNGDTDNALVTVSVS